jgi:hypothetical protein
MPLCRVFFLRFVRTGNNLCRASFFYARQTSWPLPSFTTVTNLFFSDLLPCLEQGAQQKYMFVVCFLPAHRKGILTPFAFLRRVKSYSRDPDEIKSDADRLHPWSSF